MEPRYKVRIAKELKYFSYALILALICGISTFVIGSMYEKEEYANYLKEKEEEEIQFKKIVEENKAKATKGEEERCRAIVEMKQYIYNNKNLFNSYVDLCTRCGVDLKDKDPDLLGSADKVLLNFVQDGLIEGRFPQKDAITLRHLLSNYQKAYSFSTFDELKEKGAYLERVSSFDNYRKYLSDSYPDIRKIPPIDYSARIFLSVLLLYFYCRLFIFVIAQIIKLGKWINVTSKLK